MSSTESFSNYNHLEKKTTPELLQIINKEDKSVPLIIKKSLKWGTDENMMFVVGATRSENIAEVRKLAPKNFFLVPGLGSQGGSLNDIIDYGWNNECGLLINSSRGIIYASNKNDFAEKAGLVAKSIQTKMSKILDEKNF